MLYLSSIYCLPYIMGRKIRIKEINEGVAVLQPLAKTWLIALSNLNWIGHFLDKDGLQN